MKVHDATRARALKIVGPPLHRSPHRSAADIQLTKSYGTAERGAGIPGHPMSAGDAIVIYCAGLGPVNPPVTAGSAAPSSPPATTTNPVTVTIGGKSAQVFFSGLVGRLAGEYQVNAYVPKGITPGDAVPLVITVAGFESAPVTVAVK